MDFALRWNDGHFGPRKFWVNCLPRLKFWNPAVPMIVNRSAKQDGPATMSIYFRQPTATAEENNSSSSSTATSSSGTTATPKKTILTGLSTLPLAQQPRSSVTGEFPAPAPSEGEHVVTIDMKNVHSDRILEEFLAKTGARLVRPTADEEVEMRQVQERVERGNADRIIVKAFEDEKRKKQAMLEKIKKEADAIKASNQ
ncbi:CI-B8 domain-containing protein [Microdochium trichocladiopsis]|uniref:CI-B8 domain-containing protein n=1 Tax=Microdochium trichocladiopsis TaxID=1682393 RepID=A0A9P8YJB7_9PEZI|nr:CI-B8 domain-containing protein [Microdochium trichocladiopsis]KAH7040090.1 CI-B8 domain-containing protein [Microdochium trichocladiopsis]